MKKAMIGILILIPVLIMVVVAMVSSIVSLQAWIAVDSIELTYKGSDVEAENIKYSLDEVANKTLNIYDYVDVKVYPEKAKNYSVEWRISGDVSYTDDKHQAEYEKYKSDFSALKQQLEQEFSQKGSFEDEDKQSAYESVKSRYPGDTAKMLDAMAKILIPEVKPALAFVDRAGNVVESNSTGDFIVCAFCHGTIEVIVENISKTLLVSVGGDDVKSVTVSSIQGDDSNTLNVGESKRITASYTPIDSIVGYTIWHALDEDIASVDQNGVITAKKAGTARFTMDASVHSTEQSDQIEYVTSNVYTIEVKASGASSIFGSKANAHKRSYSLAELGIGSYQSVDGATIVDGNLTVDEGVSVVTINTDNGSFTLNLCDENDIAIANSAFYNAESGYVVAVGEHTLKLNAIWASVFKLGTPNVVWSSDNENVANVSQSGEVLAKSGGNVTVTATSDSGVSCSIVLNVRNKISYLQLRTSNEALAVGLARETVFASFRYVNDDISLGDETETNHTLITVLGEPKRTNDMTADEYEATLASFYDAYVFEIVEGGEYAHFDEITKNKLVFNPDALEGKGKQAIRVKVGAKYPKYEGMTKFTTAEVTINAVYGVAVYNVAQMENAAKYQRTYSEFDEFLTMRDAINAGGTYETKNGNLQPAERIFSHQNANTGDNYIVEIDGRSLRTYAIVMMANCDYGEGVDKSDVKAIGSPNDRLNFFGDVYGNNKMICALTGQVNEELVRVSWSGVTVSNVTLRANDIDGDGNIDSDDTKAFKGTVCVVGSHHDWNRYRLTDITFEYCIIENGRQGVTTRNSDVTYNGCVMRNFLQCGMYVPQQMNRKDEDNAYHPYYSHITFNNFTCSNMIGSIMSATYERYTITEQKQNRFVPDGSREENGQYFMQYFASQGINLEVTQTGFLKAYNWQNVNNANIIDTGNKTYNDLIASLAGGIIRDNKSFADYRYVDSNNEYWFHLAFLVSGISLDKGIMDEPTFAKMSFSSSDIGGVCLGNIDSSGEDGGSLVGGLISTMYIYGYKNTSAITPFSRLVIDTDFILSLH